MKDLFNNPYSLRLKNKFLKIEERNIYKICFSFNDGVKIEENQ